MMFEIIYQRTEKVLKLEIQENSIPVKVKTMLMSRAKTLRIQELKVLEVSSTMRI